MLEFTFSLQNTGDKYHIAVPMIEASMKRWKSSWNYKLDNLPLWDELARHRLDGWCATWAGNWVKGCTQRVVIRVWPALVPTAQERHRKPGEGPKECHDLASEQWQEEISSLEKRNLRGNLITLFQWLFLGNCKEDSVSAWGTTWRGKGEMVAIYTRKRFILV